MTMKERLFLEHPEKIKKDCAGGVFGCPYWYGLERHAPRGCHMEEKHCRKCWSRKYKEC